VVEYTYDAWGKLLTTTGSMASTLGVHNPLRYRGYVYDTELGLYYLQSRYYNPEMGRFINADAYTSTGQGVLGNNMFAYCENSPIINVDFGGAKPCLVNRCAKWEGADLLIPIVDLTEKLNEFMIENATKLQEYRDTNGFIEAAFYFYANVVDEGELDIKLQDDWKFEEDKVYKYNETFLRYDDPGNLNFGYVGAVLFSEEFLCFGAGLNQISKYGFAFGDISTFYDDPRDNIMIKLGYTLYWEAKNNE
jgi:RHS repeat-associated protein